MEKEMASVLQNAMRYEVRCCIICCILLVICTVGILCTVLIRKANKIPVIGKVIAYVVILLFVVVGIAYIVQVKMEIGKIQNDIAQSQYVTYEGVFVAQGTVLCLNTTPEGVAFATPFFAGDLLTHDPAKSILDLGR